LCCNPGLGSGDNRLHAFDGDTGALLFTSEPLAGVRRYHTPIAAKGRLYLASDAGLVAFDVGGAAMAAPPAAPPLPSPSPAVPLASLSAPPLPVPPPPAPAVPLSQPPENQDTHLPPPSAPAPPKANAAVERRGCKAAAVALVLLTCAVLGGTAL
jgi:hypothetical protein